jgi:hypothetical protein
MVAVRVPAAAPLRLSDSRWLAIAFAAICWSSSYGADGVVQLPQDHDYQVVLREYLATLKPADFKAPLQPVEFRELWARDDESLHRLWLLAQTLPDIQGLLMADVTFTLREIESPDGIRMRVGKRWAAKDAGAAVHPEDTVWWSTWDWRGNPYRGSRGVRNRAFVVAAVDMIMLDKLHESGTDWVKNARRSDNLGGQLAWMAHVYRDVRADLPKEVQSAYEAGLTKFLDRLAEWGPTSVNDNMDTKALIAAAYLADTFREGPVVEKARAYANRALERFHPAGLIRDAGGLEASYNGCAAFNIAWATAVKPWPEFVAALRRMSDVKAHLTLPEPDLLHFWGPSHFSSRTSLDPANDQWAFPQRDIAIAMHADEALYLMFGGRFGRRPAWAVPDRAEMVRDVKAAVDRLNKSLKPSQDRFDTWGPSFWASGKFNFAYDHYTPGFYDLLRRLRAERHPAALPPMVRPDETFIRQFPPADMPGVADADRNTFLVARFPEYGTIIYTGPIGWHSYMNFAGGGLSAFWMPAAGSLLLGRNGNPVQPETSRQSWADWRVWPTHAISGQTASGDAFSSARIRRRVSKVEYEVGRHAATVSISGHIGKQHDESRAAQNGCITGSVKYSRSLSVEPRGVVVETRLDSDGKDKVTDLCEIIPLALHDEKWQVATPEKPEFRVPHRVLFVRDGQSVAPGEDFVDGVSAIQVDRFFGAMRISFEQPQRVRLGEKWTTNYQSAMSIQNILIDLLPARSGAVPLESVLIRYRIEPKPMDADR